MSRAEKYLASVCSAQKSPKDSLAIAVQVLPDTIDGLRATGVMPATIAFILALEIKKIAEEQDWSLATREQFMPPAFMYLFKNDVCT